MYEFARLIIEERFGSINKMAKTIGVEACDLYAGFKGTKTLYPKYKRLIAEALETDEKTLFGEDRADD